MDDFCLNQDKQKNIVIIKSITKHSNKANMSMNLASVLRNPKSSDFQNIYVCLGKREGKKQYAADCRRLKIQISMLGMQTIEKGFSRRERIAYSNNCDVNSSIQNWGNDSKRGYSCNQKTKQEEKDENKQKEEQKLKELKDKKQKQLEQKKQKQLEKEEEEKFEKWSKFEKFSKFENWSNTNNVVEDSWDD